VNYYDLLQVSKDASHDEIANSFRRLIKQYHPDRYSSPDEKEKAEKKFAEITSAFNVLKDEGKRAAYNRTLEDDSEISSHEDTKAQAMQFFKNGLYQMNTKEDIRMAEEFFRKAAHMDRDNARFLYYLGIAQSKLPGKKRTAVENLERASALDPFSAVYKASIGQVYLESGMKTRAIKYFEKALKLDGGCQEAIDGLAAMGIKRKEDAPKGLLSRLFGRK